MMAGRAWAIKLGSGGRCIPFCERHSIVGIGWKDVTEQAVSSGDRDELLAALKGIDAYANNQTSFGQWVGSLNRFGHECSEGDFVLYYDPSSKHVQIMRVVGPTEYRIFDLEALDLIGEPVDIWHVRRVKKACEPILILDFYGALKGKLLGPRGTFWQLHDQFALIEQLTNGSLRDKNQERAAEIQAAKSALDKLIIARTEPLNERHWELLAADYFRGQGATVNEDQIGGNGSVIDFEAVFDHGEIPESVWRVQVKRYERRQVDRPELELFARQAGNTHLCFVSVFGFTESAANFAEDSSMLLLQAESFSSFIMSDKKRRSLFSEIML